ncbi:MAG: DUF998 domain-containing protein [Flavobacteriales bacterium]|nr:DUF998 domain-containing protein [Flavobacteriales bacterium]
MEFCVPPPVWTRLVLLIVLGYEAAGAIVGGILLVVAPDGRHMDMPVGIMHGTFRDFLIPGAILLGLGILNAFSFTAVLRRRRNDWSMAVLGLGGLSIWFVVEIIILRELHWLHAMWGLPVLLGWVVAIPLIASRNNTAAMQRGLLLCGAISSLWYVVINAIVPMFYPGYSVISVTPSELSAIGAPTRLLWVLLVLPYPLLMSALGWGLVRQTVGDRRLRIVGILTIAYGIFNFYWPPMHMRGIEPSLTDTLHIVWAAITMFFMWTLMILGALSLGRGFRIVTIAAIVAHVVFGLLTSSQAPNIPIDGPTPTIGLWERINIAIFMVWVVVFVLQLLRRLDVYRSGSAQPFSTPTHK